MIKFEIKQTIFIVAIIIVLTSFGLFKYKVFQSYNKAIENSQRNTDQCVGKPISIDNIVGTWVLAPAEMPYNVHITPPKIVVSKNGGFVFKGWKSNDFISYGVISKVNKPTSFSLDFIDYIEYWEKFVKSSLKEKYARLLDNKAKFLVDVSQFSYPDGTCQYRFWMWGWQFEQNNKVNKLN